MFVGMRVSVYSNRADVKTKPTLANRQPRLQICSLVVKTAIMIDFVI